MALDSKIIKVKEMDLIQCPQCKCALLHIRCKSHNEEFVTFECSKCNKIFTERFRRA